MMADDDDDRASNSAGGSAEHKISSQTGGVWIWQPEQECQVCAAMQVGQHSRQGRSTWLGLCSDAGSTNRWPGPGPGVRCDAGGTKRWPGPGPGVQTPGQECMAGSMQRCRYHKPVARARTGCTLRCRWHETAASAGAQGRVQVTRNFNFTESACLPSAGRYRRITLLAAHAAMSQHTETRSHVLPVKNPMTVLESSCL
ncbi:hypothetical protein JYU34_010444 [Plutella xylostella]|uniref:Uncharacterized protein n=1 Tax=Plutella xylostella TaxID=51655 RepID=A0ABQ7QIF0_PLUXY|nr:hypothetical protein JYU34_010444 [Plutella xylostella]